jgi:hypothetical protein
MRFHRKTIALSIAALATVFTFVGPDVVSHYFASSVKIWFDSLSSENQKMVAVIVRFAAPIASSVAMVALVIMLVARGGKGRRQK